MKKDYVENLFFSYLRLDYFEIDEENGLIWRTHKRCRGSKFNLTWFRLKERRLATTNSGDYLGVSITARGRKHTAMAHRLVWRWANRESDFEPATIPEGELINHRDGDKRHNSPSNLECVTTSENMQHAKDVLREGPWGQALLGPDSAIRLLKEANVKLEEFKNNLDRALEGHSSMCRNVEALRVLAGQEVAEVW